MGRPAKLFLPALWGKSPSWLLRVAGHGMAASDVHPSGEEMKPRVSTVGIASGEVCGDAKHTTSHGKGLRVHHVNWTGEGRSLRHTLLRTARARCPKRRVNTHRFFSEPHALTQEIVYMMYPQTCPICLFHHARLQILHITSFENV